MKKFKVISEFTPKRSSAAIKKLKNGIDNIDFQTLMGIAGSGKSATIAWLRKFRNPLCFTTKLWLHNLQMSLNNFFLKTGLYFVFIMTITNQKHILN